ncbi:hypothetical protein ACHAAC_08325 [Aeromicrobium sp. CF4.19]|uniref:hypothetical protein n=1 Tax=Aeromicrobium sp. CF4.19 TaxID=3373082 RepID=UPI003EE5A381
MTVTGGPDHALADAVGRAILDSGDGPAGPDDPLALVRRAAEADAVVGDLLRQAVASARSAGQSWASIGHELGMSRQAVQQRFGVVAELDDPTERWLGPVTAFDEMAELELAGRLGWRTVEAGLLRHRMVRTSTQWEHRRVVWTRPPTAFARDGWQIGCRAFPWLYLVRDTGRPVED